MKRQSKGIDALSTLRVFLLLGLFLGFTTGTFACSDDPPPSRPPEVETVEEEVLYAAFEEGSVGPLSGSTRRTPFARDEVAPKIARSSTSPKPSQRSKSNPLKVQKSDAEATTAAKLAEESKPEPLTPEEEEMAALVKHLRALATNPTPWGRPGSAYASLYDARLLMHRVEGGVAIDFGAPASAKNVRGRWKSGWSKAKKIPAEKAIADGLPDLADRWVVHALGDKNGASPQVWFPLPEDLPQDEDYLLEIKLRPEQLNRRFGLKINGKLFKTVELESRKWQTVRVKIPANQLRFGEENHFSFFFAKTFFVGPEVRSAARFDYLRLAPMPLKGTLRNPPPHGDPGNPDARVLDTVRRSLGLSAPGRLDSYFVLPAEAALRFYVAPAPITQSPKKLRVSVKPEGGASKMLLEIEVEPGQPWQPYEVDLSEFSGKGVRLSFEVPQGEGEGPISEKGEAAIYMGDPWILQRTPFPARRWIPAAPKRVIVITVDALRSDHVFGSHGKGLTPNIQRLRAEGVSLDGFAAGPGAVISTASLLSGVYPAQHRVGGVKDYLKTRFTTLGEMFQESGSRTVMLTTNPFILRSQGYAQGFDIYHNLVREEGAATTARLIEMAILKLRTVGSGPLLMYLHIAGLRLPHVPSSAALARINKIPYAGLVNRENMSAASTLNHKLTGPDLARLDALYDAELFEIDAHIGRLLGMLEEGGHMDDTLVVLTGSHAEPLGSEGFVGYSDTLTPPELRIPFVFRGAGLPQGTSLGFRMEQVDLLPTLAGLSEFEVPDSAQGKDLVRLLGGAAGRVDAPAFSSRGKQHSVAMGGYFYRLGESKEALLLMKKASAGKDIRASSPITYQALRDLLSLQLAFGQVIDKSREGDLLLPRGLPEKRAEEGW